MKKVRNSRKNKEEQYLPVLCCICVSRGNMCEKPRANYVPLHICKCMEWLGEAERWGSAVALDNKGPVVGKGLPVNILA